jgi:N-acetylmuramoyl-L-alanine amidase
MADRKSTKHIVLHCSASRPAQFVNAKIIGEWHRARGWKSIGYHYVILRDGKVETGRPVNAVGSHVAGHNSTTLGICIVGGLNDATGKAENNFTTAQWGALDTLLRDLCRRFPKATILGHRDLSPDKDRDGVVERHEWLKECPCFDAAEWAERHGFSATFTGVRSKAKSPLKAAPLPVPRPPEAPQGEDAGDDGGDLGELMPPEAIEHVDVAPATPDRETIERVQAALRRLNYFGVGKVDGDMAAMTRGAIVAFKHEHGLAPETPEITEAFLARLATASPRQVSDARANATAADVAASVPTVNETWWSRTWAKVLTIPAAIATAVGMVREAVRPVREALEPVTSMLGHVPWFVWCAGALGVGVLIWRSQRHAEESALDLYRQGRVL